MKLHLARWILLAWLLAPPALAAELVVNLSEGRVNVRIAALQYPVTLPRELTSGLNNRILARLSLRAGGAVVEQRTAEITIRYDLWDQEFDVSIDVDGRVQRRRLADLAQLNAFLAALEIRGVFAVASLPQDRDVFIEAELLLNPIGREKLGMIRKWVAQNSTPQAGGESAGYGRSELFNHIFEQYADGSQLAATWRVQLSSKPFRPNSLPHERP
jgi:hypothetical protein